MTASEFQQTFSLPTAAASIVVATLLLAFGTTWLHALGYVLSCPIPIVLVTSQRRATMRVQTRQGIVAPAHTKAAAVAILLVGLFVGWWHAWFFAWDVASW